MEKRPDIGQIVGSDKLGDNLNASAGQWLSMEFRSYNDIADFMNSARVNIGVKNITWANNRFYVLFMVDASAKVRVVKKSRKKKGVNNG